MITTREIEISEYEFVKAKECSACEDWGFICDGGGDLCFGEVETITVTWRLKGSTTWLEDNFKYSDWENFCKAHYKENVPVVDEVTDGEIIQRDLNLPLEILMEQEKEYLLKLYLINKDK